MKQVTLHQAKSNLSALLRLVEKGERVVITRSGKPFVELKIIESKPGKRALKQTFGGWEEHKNGCDELENADLSGAWREFQNEDILNP